MDEFFDFLKNIFTSSAAISAAFLLLFVAGIMLLNYIYDKSRRPLVDELLKCKDEIRRLHEKMEAREIEFKRQLDESQDMVLELQKELLDSEKEVSRLILELSDAEEELGKLRGNATIEDN